MITLVKKIIIQILLHIMCNLMVILSSDIAPSDFLYFFYSETGCKIGFFASIIFYQVYIYLTYRIGELRKKAYKIVYWVFNFVCLGATLILWFPCVLS